MFKVIKAGKLANGAERGKGSIVHLSKSDYCGPALCGASPKISWLLCQDKDVTCPKCIKIEGQRIGFEALEAAKDAMIKHKRLKKRGDL